MDIDEYRKRMAERNADGKRQSTQAQFPRRPERQRAPYIPRSLQERRAITATLFVPEGFPTYDKMLSKHVETSGMESYFGLRCCVDGVTRNGLYVPPTWGVGPVSNREYIAAPQAPAPVQNDAPAPEAADTSQSENNTL